MMQKVIDSEGQEFGFESGEWPIPSGRVAAFTSGGEFYIRATAGGDLFDPLEGDQLAQKDRDRAGLRFELKKCGPNCFQAFARFLQSKSRSFLVAAQRDFLNEPR